MKEIERFPAGKVPWEFIAREVHGKLPPEVLLGPAVGEDAALIKIGAETWAVATDPITFTSKDSGRLSVVVNANDIAVRGATPKYFTAVVLLSPQQSREQTVLELLDDIRSECERRGIALVGGHTEVTPGLPHTIIVGTMLGKVCGRAITTGGVREGNLVGMTKWAGLEGTAILLNEFEQRLRTTDSAEAFEEAREILESDWLSIIPEAAAATACPHVTALHDVTEGGVGEALYEMGTASGLHIRAQSESIPVLPLTRLICSDLGMNPFGLIGSGSLLIACAREGKDDLEKKLADRNIPFSWIGTAEAGSDESSAEPQRFQRDEILKAWLPRGMEACVFDMDGTVIDSEYDWVAMRTALGVGSGSIIEQLNDLEGEEKETKLAELRRIEREVSLAAHVKDGAAELLALLKDRGIRTALVTNNSDENTSFLKKKFGLAFDVTITRDSGLHKPSGAPVAEAVRRLGTKPEKTFCVGDSLYDVLACRDAGCAWVCILHDDKNIYASHADLCFPTIGAFTRYLKIVL